MSTDPSPRPFHFEVGMYRPPSEGGSFSLLLRVTRNCPWNRCAFCHLYKDERFERRSVEEILADIDAVAALRDRVESISERLGYGGELNRHVITELLQSEPEIGLGSGVDIVINWLAAGARTVFLQDGDSIALRGDRLIRVLRHLRETFPTIERITSYARAKTLYKKDLDELSEVRQAGLDRLHVGLESGDDEVLERVAKGVTGEQQVIAGRTALDAGFELSAYWMPGLGGRERWRGHAENTARVLNAIDPHYARSRPFYPVPGTPILDQIERGELHLLDPYEHLLEVRTTVERLELTGRVCFDHAANYWRGRTGATLLKVDYEGYKLPEEKELLLELLDEGLEVLGGPREAL